MQARKISISLTKPAYEFVENYQATHHCKSRSEVINQALKVLQKNQLASCYQEANDEIDNSFESTTNDGLSDEAW